MSCSACQGCHIFDGILLSNVDTPKMARAVMNAYVRSINQHFVDFDWLEKGCKLNLRADQCVCLLRLDTGDKVNTRQSKWLAAPRQKEWAGGIYDHTDQQYQENHIIHITIRYGKGGPDEQLHETLYLSRKRQKQLSRMIIE